MDTASLKVQKTTISDNDFLYSMQLQDDKIVQIIKKMNAKEPVMTKDYENFRGRLYRNVNGRKLWVVPKSLRWRIVNNNHDKAGHLAVDKTIQRIQEFMWFPKMRNFVKSYIKSCVDCAYNKKPGGKQEGVYYYDDPEPVPFHTIHLDHVGPFPKSSRRNEHIIVIVDAFTKYTIIRAVKSTATKHVIPVLEEVSSYVGVPTRIITDRGTAFTSKEFGRYCHDYNIKHIQNAVRTPRANGHAERTNRTLLSMLRTMTDRDKNWDVKLRNIQWSINTMCNKTTGQTPHELVYGFTPRDILKNKITLMLQDDCKEHEADVEQVRKDAVTRITRAKQKAKERYDKQHATPFKYEVDDLVLAENEAPSTGESRKLEPKYKGPYMVARVLDNNRYVITDLPVLNELDDSTQVFLHPIS